MNTNIKRSRGFTLIELLVVIAIFCIVLTLVIGAGAAITGCSISDGSRAGMVTKFSHKGIFNKTWEGEMVLGGMRGNINGGYGANIWRFSVKDDAVAKQVDEAKDAMEPIILYYHQQLVNIPITKDTTYTVWKVEQPKKIVEK